jgi:hypothetical protein
MSGLRETHAIKLTHRYKNVETTVEISPVLSDFIIDILFARFLDLYIKIIDTLIPINRIFFV